MLIRHLSIAQNSYFDLNGLQVAEVAELVYALDLGSSAERRESSSLSFRTNLNGHSGIGRSYLKLQVEG